MYGRGIDNVSRSARYEVRVNGQLIGAIYSRHRRAFETAIWLFDTFEDGVWRPCREFGRFKLAKEYVARKYAN